MGCEKLRLRTSCSYDGMAMSMSCSGQRQDKVSGKPIQRNESQGFVRIAYVCTELSMPVECQVRDREPGVDITQKWRIGSEIGLSVNDSKNDSSCLI